MAQLHVSNIDGNDSTGDGSASKPYKTLAKARAVYAANDEILLENGSVWSNHTLQVFSKSVTISNYGTGALPKLDGNDVGAISWDSMIKLQASHSRVENIHLYRCPGVGLLAQPSSLPISHINISGVIVEKPARAAVQFLNGVQGNSSIVDTEVIESARNYGAFGHNDWSGAIVICRNSAAAHACSGILVERSLIRDCWGEGFLFFGNTNDCILRDCKSLKTRRPAYYMDGAYNIEIDRCLALGSTDSRFHSGGVAAGWNLCGISIAVEGFTQVGGEEARPWNDQAIFVHGIHIHDCWIAGFYYGLSFGRPYKFAANPGHFYNMTIEHNTFVDCGSAIQNSSGLSGIWGANNKIENNAFISRLAGSNDVGTPVKDANAGFANNYYSQGQPTHTAMRGAGDIYGGAHNIQLPADVRASVGSNFNAVGPEQFALGAGSVLLNAANDGTNIGARVYAFNAPPPDGGSSGTPGAISDTRVQRKPVEAYSDTNPLAFTFDNEPAAGNLILAWFTLFGPRSAFDWTGLTIIADAGSEEGTAFSSVFAYKWAGENEGTPDYELSCEGGSLVGRGAIIELPGDGLDRSKAPTVKQVVSQVNTVSQAISLPSMTANGLLAALVSIDDEYNGNGEETWENGFNAQYAATGHPRVGAELATKALAGVDVAESTRFEMTVPARRMFGAIAHFPALPKESWEKPTLSNLNVVTPGDDRPGEMDISFDSSLTTGEGRTYGIASQSQTEPDAPQLRAGLDGDGNQAVWAANKPAAEQAEQTFTATGLAGDAVERYYVFVGHLEE